MCARGAPRDLRPIQILLFCNNTLHDVILLLSVGIYYNIYSVCAHLFIFNVYVFTRTLIKIIVIILCVFINIFFFFFILHLYDNITSVFLKYKIYISPFVNKLIYIVLYRFNTLRYYYLN